MSALRSKLSLLFLFLSLFAASAVAQDLDLGGSVGWRKIGRVMRIHAERIENNGTNRSGFLRLQIWATTNVYDGTNDITGYVLGTFNLGSLDPDTVFVNASRLVRFLPPPPGLYYTTMTLEEETADGFLIVDSVNFEGIVNFGGYGAGALNDLAPNGEVTFAGDVSWLAGNRHVEIFAGQILNTRATGRTGVLRIRLWATTTPYDGSFLSGYPMATVRVGRVYAGFFLPDFDRRTFFRAPPTGEYFVTMTLEEFSGGGWNIRDYVNFPGTSVF